jgi:hypothetical protein
MVAVISDRRNLSVTVVPSEVVSLSDLSFQMADKSTEFNLKITHQEVSATILVSFEKRREHCTTIRHPNASTTAASLTIISNDRVAFTENSVM